MIKEEAIKNIKEHCYFANLIPQAKEALDMAIKTLEQEPCEDCVSRQAVLDILMPYCADDDGSVGNTDDLRNALDDIESLPPVQPIRQKKDFKEIWDRI